MRALICCTLLCACASHAAAATLRPASTLQRPTVLLSDLFDDAGPLASHVLGSGPAPGERIVVPAAQLAAIARQFGVDWRPASPSDRAVIERAGRVLSRSAVLAPLRESLRGAGAPADFDLSVPEFAAPMVPEEVAVQTTVEQLDYDPGTSRFTAALVLAADGMPTRRLRISGEVSELVDLPVPVRRLLPGTVVTADDLRLARIRTVLVRGEVARQPAQALGLALRRPAAAGQPLPLADLGEPTAVTKGARVAMALDLPGLALAAQGVALEAGAVGERIRVLNPASRAVVEAEVIGPGRVRVTPGTLPQPTPAAMQAALR